MKNKIIVKCAACDALQLEVDYSPTCSCGAKVHPVIIAPDTKVKKHERV